MTSSFVTELRLHLKSNRFLYPLLKRLRDPRAYSKLCHSLTDVCLEGYTSSGNSFAYNFLRILFPNLDIAHHSHSTANVKNALARGLPCLILLRDPLECISSRVVRFHDADTKASLAAHVREYNWFYRTIRKLHERARTAPAVLRIHRFQQIVENPSNLSENVLNDVLDNRVTRTEDEYQFARELAHKSIEEWAKRGTTDDPSLTKSRPSPKRSQLKDQVKKKLTGVHGIQDARDLHEQLSNRAYGRAGS